MTGLEILPAAAPTWIVVFAATCKRTQSTAPLWPSLWRRPGIHSMDQRSEDLQLELEALQATYQKALTVSAAESLNSSSSSGGGGSSNSDAMHLELALEPQTGSDGAAAAFVAAALLFVISSSYPAEPASVRLLSARGMSNCQCMTGPRPLMAAFAAHTTSSGVPLRVQHDGCTADASSSHYCALPSAHCRLRQGASLLPQGWVRHEKRRYWRS